METSGAPTREQVKKRFPHLEPVPELPHLAQLSGEKVLMFAQSPFTFTLHHGQTIDFFKGMNAVPVELKDHPYILANMKPGSEVEQEAGAKIVVNPQREEAINWVMSEQVADGEQADREAATKIVDDEGTKAILAHKNYVIDKKQKELKAQEEKAEAPKVPPQKNGGKKNNIAVGLGFDSK